MPVARIPEENWFSHILMCCPLATLIQASHVCRTLWKLMNDPEFVVQYCTLHRFMKPRHCYCDRNVFILDVVKLCPFLRPFVGTHTPSIPGLEHLPLERNGVIGRREVQLLLRYYGRGEDMLAQSLLRQANQRLVPFDERALDKDAAEPARELLRQQIVPCPRMLRCGNVELVSIDPWRRGANYVPADHRWEYYHQVTDEEVQRDHDIKNKKTEIPPSYYNARYRKEHVRLTGFDDTNYLGDAIINPVRYFVERCLAEGRDPYDPAEDSEDQYGARAARWALNAVHNTPLVLQSFPLSLCLHPSELPDGLVRTQGPRMMPVNYYNGRDYGPCAGAPEILMVNSGGLVLFQGIRYDNVEGDFCTWALHTMAHHNSLYMFLWRDAVRIWLDNMVEFLNRMVGESHADLPMPQLVRRWRCVVRFCPSLQRFDPIPLPRDDLERWHKRQIESAAQCRRDKEAIALIQEGTYNREFNLIHPRVQSWVRSPTPHQVYHQRYLRDIVPNHLRHLGSATTEQAYVSHMMDLLRIADFLLRFGECFVQLQGPAMTSRRTELRYLSSRCASLCMLSPHWTRLHGGGLKHYQVDREVPVNVLRVNIGDNHTRLECVEYLNRRSQYYEFPPLYSASHPWAHPKFDVTRQTYIPVSDTPTWMLDSYGSDNESTDAEMEV